MNSKSKLNLGRVNAATLARIKDLRSALEFFKLNPKATIYDLNDRHPEWSASKCSKVVRSLVTCELIRMAGQTGGRTSPRATYSPTIHTQEDIDRELPIDLELSRTSGRKEDEPHPPVKFVTDWERGKVRRDPLTTYLMGSGIAPSLTFKQRSALSIGMNFINSTNGG